MEKISLYLLRHGRQNSALCNVNVPLSESGKAQAELAGQRLKGYGIGIIYSSDLIRAKETAQIINKYLSVEHLCLTGLREIDFGSLTGMSDSDIKKKYARFLEERDKYESDIPFPSGENGEKVYTRAKEAIDVILKKCINEKIESAAIISHGGAIRSILAGVLGMPQEHRLLFAKTMENTGITQIDYYVKSDRFYVERINDYAHLEGHPELLRANVLRKEEMRCQEK